MIETFIVAFTTFFATIGPIDVAAVYAVLVKNHTRRRSMAFRGVAIATIILVLFALLGDALLSTLGVSITALKIAAGIMLLLIGLEMVFARSSGGTSATKDEEDEAALKADISVFPLATPLIAGPGAMGAVILLMTEHEADPTSQAIVLAGLLTVLALTLISLLIATTITKWLGLTGIQVIARVFGVLLTGLAVQFVLDGIRAEVVDFSSSFL